MKLSQYAKKMGVTYQTAHKWYKNGQIEGAYQLSTGTIVVSDEKKQTKRTKTVIYARVFSVKQDQIRQVDRLVDFCLAKGWVVDDIIEDVGSGLNDDRKQVTKFLKDPTVKRIVVERKERLTRFGFHYLEVLAELEGFEIVVANKTPDDDKEDLLADFRKTITYFCERLYSHSKRKQKQFEKLLQK